MYVHIGILAIQQIGGVKIGRMAINVDRLHSAEAPNHGCARRPRPRRPALDRIPNRLTKADGALLQESFPFLLPGGSSHTRQWLRRAYLAPRRPAGSGHRQRRCSRRWREVDNDLHKIRIGKQNVAGPVLPHPISIARLGDGKTIG